MTTVHTWQFPDAVTALATSPDGRVMVTGCFDNRVRVHNVVEPPFALLCETTEELCEAIRALAVRTSDDDNLMVVTVHNKWMVRCWRVAARQLLLEWVGDGTREEKKKGPRCYASAVCISHNCKWVAVGGVNWHRPGDAEHDICLFGSVGVCADGDEAVAVAPYASTSAPRRPARMFMGHTNPPRGLCFSPDDRLLVSGGIDKTLRVWSVESGEQLQCVPLDAVVSCVAIRGCVAQIVTGDDGGSARLWQTDFATDKHRVLDSEYVRFYTDPQHLRALRLCCTEDGTHVIVGGDATVQIWNLARVVQPVAVLHGHTRSVDGIGVTSVGNLVTGSYDATVRLWRLDDPDVRRAIAPVRTLLEKERVALKRVRDACVSPSPAAAVVLTIIILGHTKRIAKYV